MSHDLEGHHLRTGASCPYTRPPVGATLAVARKSHDSCRTLLDDMTYGQGQALPLHNVLVGATLAVARNRRVQ